METNIGKVEQKIEILPPSIVHEVLCTSLYAGGGLDRLFAKPSDPFLIRNQARFVPAENNVMLRALAHNEHGDKVLGVRKITRRQFGITVDGEQIITQEATPAVVNKWISWANKRPCSLMAADEARKTPYGGGTVLQYVTGSDDRIPEMVLRAGDGNFYPATSRDIIVETRVNAPW